MITLQGHLRFFALCLGAWVIPPLSEYYHTLLYLGESHQILLGARPIVDSHPHQALHLCEPYENAGLVNPAFYPQTDNAEHDHQYQGPSLS